jgi:putative ABC transport system permease protein
MKQNIRTLENLLQDLRYGVRMLWKQPVFTLIVLITLALGIGANTAIFSVVNAVLLRPLPFREPERLTMVWNMSTEGAGGDRTPMAVSELLDWRAQSKVFESIGAFHFRFYNYVDGELPERVIGANVTSNFFTTLGVNAALGRTFLPEEGSPGAARAAVISDSFWRKNFAADPQVIGRAIKLNDDIFTIVGVMPANLNFPSRLTEIWTPIQISQPTQWGPWFLTGIGRLKPGVTLQQAHADIRTMKINLGGKNFNFNLLPVNDYIVGDVRLALVALLVAVTLLLLIATVNVANLTLVRSTARTKEISIRIAVGAGRWRIVRQLLTESLLLAFVGGALGVALATWGIGILRKVAPPDIARLDQVGVDMRTLGWTALISLLTSLIFGLAPAWQNSRLNLNDTLKEGGRNAPETPNRGRSRKVLVVAELALAVTMLIGAGLLVKSLWRLQQVNVGINPERMLTMQYFLRGQAYSQPRQANDFCSRLLEQTRALPGVRAAAVSNSMPPDYNSNSGGFTIEGQAVTPDQKEQIAYFISITPDYFRTLGIQLSGGRHFSDTDSAEAPHVIIVNETLRRQFFSGKDPIGKNVNLGSESDPDWNRIVGVVGDVKYNGIAAAVQPAMYRPMAQAPAQAQILFIKSSVADPLGLVAPARNEVMKLDPKLPIVFVRTMEENLDIAYARPGFHTILFAIFAAIAFILACIGIYGVMSYSVAQRTHEIGIRMALGAQTSDVLKMVIKQGLILVVIGLAIGLAGSFALMRLMSGLLFDVKATDPATYIITALALALTALIASYIPARRAARVDPIIALRCD